MTSKSADGTPANAVQRSRVQLPSGREVRSSGRSAAEYLVKQQYARSLHPDGTYQTAVCLDEATPLHHGTSAPSMFPVCAKKWKTLRQCGHTGIALEHYVFDRKGLTAWGETLEATPHCRASDQSRVVPRFSAAAGTSVFNRDCGYPGVRSPWLPQCLQMGDAVSVQRQTVAQRLLCGD